MNSGSTYYAKWTFENNILYYSTEPKLGTIIKSKTVNCQKRKFYFLNVIEHLKKAMAEDKLLFAVYDFLL